MDQQSNTTPSVRLPQPSFDPMAARTSVSPQPQPSPIQAQPQQMHPTATMAAQVPASAPAAPAPTRAGAEDAQDEEWISKAKNIAVQYKDDPFALSNALSQLRAEYLYKQHGITTKLGKK